MNPLDSLSALRCSSYGIVVALMEVFQIQTGRSHGSRWTGLHLPNIISGAEF